MRGLKLAITITVTTMVILVLLLMIRAASDQPTGSLSLPKDLPMGFQIEKYGNFQQYEGQLRRLEEAHPAQFAYHSDRKTYGEDYDLYWVTVGDIAKPAIFVISVTHAKNEWQGAHIVMHFIEKVLDPNDNQRLFNRRLLENFCIVAIPVVNTWGYFASPDGKHYNKHASPVPGIENAKWHDMSAYDYYYGVNLNRNFDWNWEAYRSLPWSVKTYWNGKDYGYANYFMMPFYIDSNGDEIFDPTNTHPNHILKPDLEVYDYKGAAPFSEPETQLIRNLFNKYKIIGFIDWHLMNPWQEHNVSYISQIEDADSMITLVNEGLRRVNNRNKATGLRLPKSNHNVMEKYDGNAPYSVNWAQNQMGVRSFGWETGTSYPEQLWTDAYMEIFYRTIYWMQEMQFHEREVR
jgi:hypothetical protein